MSNQQQTLKLTVKDTVIGFKTISKPQLVTRSKHTNELEKTSNPQKYRLLISNQTIQHHYHYKRTIFFDINSLDILVSFNIKSKEIEYTLFAKLNDYFYQYTIQPDEAFKKLVKDELSKKGY
jgi:hypothetical protein